MKYDPTEVTSSPDLPPGRWQVLVGRRIEAVVTTGVGGSAARTQVYLVLDNDEHFEIFAPGVLQGSRELHDGGLAMLTAPLRHELQRQVYGPARPSGRRSKG